MDFGPGYRLPNWLPRLRTQDRLAGGWPCRSLKKSCVCWSRWSARWSPRTQAGVDDGGTPLRARPARSFVAGGAFLVGVVVLMTGAVTKHTVVGVIGFVVMLVSAYVALTSWRGQNRVAEQPQRPSRALIRPSASSRAASKKRGIARPSPLVVVAMMERLRGALAPPPRPERLLTRPPSPSAASMSGPHRLAGRLSDGAVDAGLAHRGARRRRLRSAAEVISEAGNQVARVR